MKNNDKMKWYLLIAIALIVGAMIGYFATNSLSTTGNANKNISYKSSENYNSIYALLTCHCSTGSSSVIVGPIDYDGDDIGVKCTKVCAENDLIYVDARR